jgi:hypothetical protein
MIYRSNGSRRLSNAILVGTSIFLAHSIGIIAQEMKGKSPTADRSHDVSSSVRSDGEKYLPRTDSIVGHSLPDAPMPAGQAQRQTPAREPFGTTLESISGIASAVDSHASYGGRQASHLHARDFWATSGDFACVWCRSGNAKPAKQYPKEWKDGADGFGRLYGARVATITSRRTAAFLTDVALHEDPRYLRSTSATVFARTAHALVFTVLDTGIPSRDRSGQCAYKS